MGFLSKIARVVFGGPLVADQLDDKAERIFATRAGNGVLILSVCVGIALLIFAARCG